MNSYRFKRTPDTLQRREIVEQKLYRFLISPLLLIWIELFDIRGRWTVGLDLHPDANDYQLPPRLLFRSPPLQEDHHGGSVGL